MNSELHARAKELFLEVCRRPLQQREEYARRLCGEQEELLAEVLSLLSFHEEPEEEVSARGELVSGQLVAGRYRIVSFLGRGAMGEVYRADDLRLQQSVALKFLPPELSRHPTWLARLTHEVRMAWEVSHPNVCRVHDLVEGEEGELFVSMEWVDGEDLGSLLRRIGRLPEERGLEMAVELCAGLQAAHQKGVLHRDLKPSNILIDREGKVRITDFGVAVSLQEAGRSPRAGTPGYIAPEVLAGAAPTVQSDLYSLGVIVREMFRGEGPQGEASSSPATPQLDPLLEHVIGLCLEEKPRRRPPSAEWVGAALAGARSLQQSMAQGQVPSPEMVAAAGERSRLSRPAAWALFGAALLLLPGILYLAPSAFKLAAAQLQEPPAVLAHQARQLLRELGYGQEPADRAFGFLPNEALPLDSPPLLFWYRESPRALVPENVENLILGEGTVQIDDPPPLEEGMINLLLDTRGRLLHLHVVPPVEGTAGDVQMDWELLFSQTALQPLREVPARLTPPVFADQRKAWEATDPEQRGRFRVEAAAHQGLPVFLEVNPQMQELPPYAEAAIRRLDFFSLAGDILLLILVGAALPLAHRHLRSGLGYRRGAFRLAAAVFLLNLSIWLLRGEHVPSLSAELFLVMVTLSRGFGEAALIWILFLALEPWVRRFWPQTLSGWNRLLEGRLRDPLLGRDLLIGSLAGIALCGLKLLDVVAAEWVRQGASRPFLDLPLPPTLTGTAASLATALELLLVAGYQALSFLLLLAALRALLRHPSPALLVFTTLLASFLALEGTYLPVSWVTHGLLPAALVAFLLLRFGLLALLATFFVHDLLLSYPLTTDPQIWYFGTTLFVVGLLVALLLWGLYQVLSFSPLGGSSTRRA